MLTTMKTAKRFTALLLCLAMLLGAGTVCAGAIEKGNEIEFTHTFEDGDTFNRTYIYQGTLTEGLNGIGYSSEYEAYSFNAEKAGFYYVVSSGCSVETAKTYGNGKADGFRDREDWIYDSKNNHGSVFYLNEETVIFLVDNYELSPSVYIEYYGEIESASDASDEICYLLNYDFEEVDANGKAQYAYFSYPFVLDINFSNGKTLSTDTEFGRYFYSDTKMINGENELTVYFLDNKLQIKLDLFEISYFIENIEASNVEKYLDVKEYYDGRIDYSEYGIKNQETLTVTFTDSTKKSFVYSSDYESDNYSTEITLPNGKEFTPVIRQITYNDGKKVFVVADSYTGSFEYDDGITDEDFGTIYLKKDCNVTKASLAENLELLKSKVFDELDSIPFLMRHYFNMTLEADDTDSAIYYFKMIFIVPINKIGFAFDEISTFFKNAF